jgi:hypothetical protein
MAGESLGGEVVPNKVGRGRIGGPALALSVIALLGAGCGFNADSGGSAGGAGNAGPAEVAPGCDPNYSGACLDPNAYDYDCAGGEGNGPGYTGTVTVIGADHYGLDRDGDHEGCEPYYP